MPLNWPTFRATLKAQAQAAIGPLPGALQVIWRDEENPFAATGAMLRLHPVASRELGPPEVCRIDNLDGTYSEQFFFPKIVTVSFLAEAFDQEPSHYPFEVLCRLRGLLQSSAGVSPIKAALQSAGISVVRMTQIVDVSGEYDQRALAAATMDLELGAGFIIEDPSLTNEWIESVEITTDYKDCTGASLPTPPNETFIVPEP